MATPAPLLLAENFVQALACCPPGFSPAGPYPTNAPALNFEKLYRPSALNSFQFIALTGLIMSAGAHLLLHFFWPQSLPAGFVWLYVCWVAFYVFGTLRNYFGKPGEGHHHHH